MDTKKLNDVSVDTGDGGSSEAIQRAAVSAADLLRMWQADVLQKDSSLRQGFHPDEKDSLNAWLESEEEEHRRQVRARPRAR